MKQTSLDLFNSLVESHYLSLKQYIVHANEEKVIIEDFENYAWRKNPDLAPLFETPLLLPIKDMDAIYREKDAMFLITLYLK